MTPKEKFQLQRIEIDTVDKFIKGYCKKKDFNKQMQKLSKHLNTPNNIIANAKGITSPLFPCRAVAHLRDVPARFSSQENRQALYNLYLAKNAIDKLGV